MFGALQVGTWDGQQGGVHEEASVKEQRSKGEEESRHHFESVGAVDEYRDEQESVEEGHALAPAEPRLFRLRYIQGFKIQNLECREIQILS